MIQFRLKSECYSVQYKLYRRMSHRTSVQYPDQDGGGRNNTVFTGLSEAFQLPEAFCLHTLALANLLKGWSQDLCNRAVWLVMLTYD